MFLKIPYHENGFRDLSKPPHPIPILDRPAVPLRQEAEESLQVKIKSLKLLSTGIRGYKEYKMNNITYKDSSQYGNYLKNRPNLIFFLLDQIHINPRLCLTNLQLRLWIVYELFSGATETGRGLFMRFLAKHGLGIIVVVS
jgi:hypothetical protein